MKKIVLLSGTIFLFACKKNENNHTVAKNSIDSEKIENLQHDSAKTEKSISDIDKIKNQYSVINNLLIAKKLDSTTIDYECDDRSGTVVFYALNGELKSIKHSYAEYSHYSSVQNYYLKEGRPFFIFQQETVWSFDGGTPEKPETKDDIEEKRFYYVNGGLVDCKDKKYTIKSSAENNPKPENIPSIESKNCSDKEVQETFAKLIKNKDKKGKIKCL